MIPIKIGADHFGKTDHLKGLFFVTTYFEHVMLFPIIPKASFCMLDCGVRNVGLPIPLSGKSILFAYIRGWIGMIDGLATLVFVLMLSSNPRPGDMDASSQTWFGVILGVAWGLVILTYWFNKPSAARAVELARIMDISLDKLIEEARFDPRMEEAVRAVREPLHKD